MRNRSQVLALACAAACTVPAAALLWTWTGGAYPNDDWDVCENWDPGAYEPDPGWPSTPNDDVLIPTPPGPQDPWSIDLIPEAVGHITIKDSVNFGAAQPNSPTLHVTKLGIQAPEDGEVVVTIGEGARIETQ